MKATGVVRQVDQLGRVVLPIELRRTMNIDIGDPIEIFVDDKHIMFKKYAPGCTLCGSIDGLQLFHQKYVCQECISAVAGSIGEAAGANEQTTEGAEV